MQAAIKPEWRKEERKNPGVELNFKPDGSRFNSYKTPFSRILLYG
jgi:hypothetical protein